MTKTKAEPGNEAWLHDAVMGMEEDGHLAEFCAHIGLDMPGEREAAEASRQILALPPYMEFLARRLGKA